MSTLPFLSDEEILQIVSPLTQPAAIVRWFREHGFANVQRRPNGMPLIGREYFNLVTSGQQASAGPSASQPVPDFDRFLKKIASDAKKGQRLEKV